MIEGKLVRDGIPDKIRANGEEPILRFLENGKILDGLARKLVEEAEEVETSLTAEDIVNELADCKEVLDSIIRLKGYNFSSISQASAKLRPQAEGEEAGLPLAPESINNYKIRLKAGANHFLQSLTEDEDPIHAIALSYDAVLFLGELYGHSPNVIAQAQLKKRQKLGGFTLGVVLEGVEQQ